MRSIIDADTLCFASAAMAEGMDDTQACWNVDTGLESLLARLNSGPNYTLYLTGENNFRYNIFPEYKANRRSVQKPEHLAAAKQHLVKEYGAIMSDGCEADDLCGVDQYQSNLNGEETIISSIDKDLDMIPGWHYRPAIWRLGVEISPEKQYYMSPLESLRFFYYQLLVGDSGDGIKGARGIGKVNAKRILEGLESEKDMYEACLDHYSCEEELEMNAKVLWIWRKENGIWEKPQFEAAEQ